MDTSHKMKFDKVIREIKYFNRYRKDPEGLRESVHFHTRHLIFFTVCGVMYFKVKGTLRPK